MHDRTVPLAPNTLLITVKVKHKVPALIHFVVTIFLNICVN